MSKYYFKSIDDEDSAASLKLWKTYMKEENISEMELFEAKRIIGEGYFYCKFHHEVGDTRQSCGK